MPLETAEETTITVEFGTSTQYFDFMRTARFVVMYNGALHTLIPTADENGGKLLAPDDQMIAYWRYWETPTLQEYITLTPGRADWRLIAIYTDGDQYQLKPQDLIGLVLPTSGTDIANAILSGNETPLVFNGHLLTVQYDSANSTAELKLFRCSESIQNCVQYENESYGSQGQMILTGYSCAATDRYLGESFKSYMEESIGLQPSQIATVTIGDLQSNVKVPIGSPEY